jgi:hypothetical protein
MSKYSVKEKNYNKLVRDTWNLPSYHSAEREIGLEIECEGSDLYKSPIQWWTTHSDHSLRPYKGHQPVEYVLNIPLSRADLTTALSYLSQKLKLSGSYVHPSPRCSVHVHINCQNLLVRQVLTIVALYTVVEDLLVEWCGPERVGNLFCLRAKDTYYLIRYLENCISKDSFRALKSDDIRYSSCNVAALGKFGSLEFRALRGTTDQKIIETWVDMILSIKSYASGLKNPREIIEKFDRLGPFGFLSAVFPDRIHMSELFKLPNIKERLWDGIRLIREIAYCSEWIDPLPLIESRIKASKSDETELIDDLPDISEDIGNIGWNIDDDDQELPPIDNDDEDNEDDE